MQKFVNGFTSWYETHHEIVRAIAVADFSSGDNLVKRTQYMQGTGGLYELAKELTDEFEKLHEGREWDGDFFDEIEEFVEKKLYINK